MHTFRSKMDDCTVESLNLTGLLNRAHPTHIFQKTILHKDLYKELTRLTTYKFQSKCKQSL